MLNTDTTSHPDSLINRQEVLYDIETFLAEHPKAARKTRWRMFTEKGTACVACGIEGTHVVKWLDSYAAEHALHMDLFATRDDGTEIMMTMDHHIPKSKGGPTSVDNLDPMCYPCNYAKADTSPHVNKKTKT